MAVVKSFVHLHQVCLLNVFSTFWGKENIFSVLILADLRLHCEKNRFVLTDVLAQVNAYIVSDCFIKHHVNSQNLQSE